MLDVPVVRRQSARVRPARNWRRWCTASRRATFLIVALLATWQAVRNGAAAVARFAVAGLLLTVLQIALGIANVLLGMPMPLREAHAANAGLTFLTYVIAATLATIGATAVSRDFRAVPQYTRAPGG